MFLKYCAALVDSENKQILNHTYSKLNLRCAKVGILESYAQ